METLPTKIERREKQKPKQTPPGTFSDAQFDSFFDRYREVIIISSVLILLGAVGLGVFSHFSRKSELETLATLYQFQQKTLGPWQKARQDNATEQKSDSIDAVLSTWKNLPEDVRFTASAYPQALELAKVLAEEKDAQAAYDFLRPYAEDVSVRNAAYPFLRWPLAVYAEDSGQLEASLKLYQELVDAPQWPQKALVKLSIGRILMKLGQNSKARNAFDEVISSDPQSEASTTAKIYLKQINSPEVSKSGSSKK